MPPALPAPSPHQARVVCYHQTHYGPNGDYVSILPLVSEASDRIGITHVAIGALHLNERPGDITLNNDAPRAPKHAPLWAEARVMQDVGVKVLGMLGGAAVGTFRRLDGDAAVFEAYYAPLRDELRALGLDGLDLDVEEDMSLAGVVRLIDRLKADFGNAFLVTLAPVAPALLAGRHLSGFDYEALERERGASIAWYHVQFYNYWGTLRDTADYDAIVHRGWPPEKVVVGVLTNPANGNGWVPLDELTATLAALTHTYPRFGGVVGWEYFNSMPGGSERPWEWAELMMKTVTNT